MMLGGKGMAVAATLLLAFGHTVGADENGWIDLFNGRNLDGWTKHGGDAPFRVEDGVIVGTFAPQAENTFLATERAFGDFVLEFEFRIDDGVNSGVQFRSLSLPEYQAGRVHGYQYEIDPSDRAYTGGIYDEARRGWLYPVSLHPPARAYLKHGEWNSGRVECIGTSIRTWLNGEAVAHLVDDATASGFVALQVHAIAADSPAAGRTVRWRNLRIRTDPPAPAPPQNIFVRNLLPNDLSDAERAQGWSRLFDGRTTAGWRSANRETFPAAGWRVRNGMLVVRPAGEAAAAGDGAPGGDIVTEREYAAFDLQFEFWLTPGANSGVKYFVVEQAATGDRGATALGLEYQILDDERHPDAKLGAAGNRTLASLYDLIPSYRSVHGRPVPRHIGAWNHGRIVALPDGRVEHWLNGYCVLSYECGSNIYAALVARSKFQDVEGFGLAERGRILLQDHGDEVRFRSIKIRELRP